MRTEVCCSTIENSQIDGDGETVIDGVGDTELDGVALTDTDGVTLAETDGVLVAEAAGEVVGVIDTDGVGEAVGNGVSSFGAQTRPDPPRGRVHGFTSHATRLRHARRAAGGLLQRWSGHGRSRPPPPRSEIGIELFRTGPARAAWTATASRRAQHAIVVVMDLGAEGECAARQSCP